MVFAFTNLLGLFRSPDFFSLDLFPWTSFLSHDDVIKWKHLPCYWSFVRENHRSPVNSPHKGQWREALMFSFICAGTNGWANNRDAGDLRCDRAHYDVTVMRCTFISGDNMQLCFRLLVALPLVRCFTFRFIVFNDISCVHYLYMFIYNYQLSNYFSSQITAFLVTYIITRFFYLFFTIF